MIILHVALKINENLCFCITDDLDISPDFFEYFASTYPILHADSSLWCVSAWNDNGKASMVAEEPELLYRTDFFPGLGWMLEKKVFLELEMKWPKTFWDDWMRHPDQRKERACIRPEVSRTTTFGKVGVSKWVFYFLNGHKQFSMVGSNSLWVYLDCLGLPPLFSYLMVITFQGPILWEASQIHQAEWPTSAFFSAWSLLLTQGMLLIVRVLNCW